MKLLLLSKTSRLIGGVETYLRDLAPALEIHGVTVAVNTEDGPLSSGWYGNAPFLKSLSEIESWGPDLLYVHGLNSPEWEHELISRWPAVFFAHNYDSTCISGLKRWERPRLLPCQKVLGPACLAHYLVNGCGGRNPVTLFRDYARNRAHQKNLGLYRSILTHSVWMKSEYARHAEGHAKVRRIPFLVDLPAGETTGTAPSATWRIGFLGRFQKAKGGDILIEAARHLADLSRPVEVWFMGEGDAEAAWKSAAEKIKSPRVAFRFWKFSENPAEYLSQLHLLAVPSRWPEPFGRVGVEAAAKGVPSVAFALGGVRDWLEPLKTGALVPLGPNPALSFSDGIRMVLEGANLEKMREHAIQSAARFSKENHLKALLPELEAALDPAYLSNAR